MSTRMASQGSAEGVSDAIDLSETFKVLGLELLDCRSVITSWMRSSLAIPVLSFDREPADL
jgi:hypothetical protein